MDFSTLQDKFRTLTGTSSPAPNVPPAPVPIVHPNPDMNDFRVASLILPRLFLSGIEVAQNPDMLKQLGMTRPLAPTRAPFRR